MPEKNGIPQELNPDELNKKIAEIERKRIQDEAKRMRDEAWKQLEKEREEMGKPSTPEQVTNAQKRISFGIEGEDTPVVKPANQDSDDDVVIPFPVKAKR